MSRIRSRRRRLCVRAASLALVVLIVATLAPATPARAAAISPDEGELDDVAVAALDPAADPEAILRARPFVIGDDPCPIFCPTRERAPFTEGAARDRLVQFLALRGLAPAEIEQALATYDDPAVTAIIPAPALRASLLMLWAWEPYAATLRAVLDGENPTGRRYAAVGFADLGVEGAVATLVATADGELAIIVDDDYEGESPAALLNVIVHESMHDPWGNSQEEEIIANILDNVLYAEALLIDPAIATEGSLLVTFNNFALLALLNSTGRAGPDRLGILATPFDDVWLGERLDEIDATSLRDAIAGDGFYAELPTGGSPGQETFWALIERFDRDETLGTRPDFDEEALRAIDQGIGEIITAADAVAIATTLDLSLAAGITESPTVGALPDEPERALALRPFVAGDPALIDLGAATAPPAPADGDATRSALAEALTRQGVGRSAHTDLLARYDDRDFVAQIPDAPLRAAAILLAAHEPWTIALAAIDGELADVGGPIPVAFADLPFGTAVARGRAAEADAGLPIFVNRDLAGEPIEVLATYLVEGLLLHERKADGRTTRDQAVLASVLGTLTYADFVLADAALTEGGTPGTILRNRDLFALVNSGAWQSPVVTDLPNAERPAIGSLGFLGAVAGVDDILPGLYADAVSYAEFVISQPRASGFSRRTRLAAAPIVASFLDFAGADVADLEGSADGMLTYGEAGAALDARLGAFISPEEALRLAQALGLGVAEPRSER